MNVLPAVLLLLIANPMFPAQDPPHAEPAETANIDMRPGNSGAPVMSAIRLADDAQIQLDGFLNEPVWRKAPVATEFTQRVPNDGQPATERTEVRILYSDTHLYVGFIAYDSSPDSIMAPLFRRDGNQPSDWVYVSIDSYNDSRTAFTFAVNPRGVQKDVLYFDDTREDLLWDAVWDVRTQIHEKGWSAEIRIPLSQLRFSATDTHVWGVNFQRRIARKNEISMWAPTSNRDSRIVSVFGKLNGISGLQNPKRLEIAPYMAGSLLRAPHPGNANPYYSTNQFSGNIGGDIKYGLTSDFTLTATINPDFGQVEADPAIINLTANESFFSERRPFFLEGNEIFRFGSTRTYSSFGNQVTFYSRRIGRAPQGHPGRAVNDATFVDQPDHSTIAAAAKLSGKTETGWSVGVLNAFTLQENARYMTTGGEGKTIAVEPATNYFVTRVKKDLNGGNSNIGGFGSAVNRNIKGTYFEDFLRSSAYLAGADFEHNFLNHVWVASGSFSLSHIAGSPDAIALAQRSPVRYFNRVDSRRLDYDPDRTSLTGYSTQLSLQKQGGNDPFLGSLTYSEVSPGYEINDLGFGNRSDYRALNGGFVLRDISPKHFQYYDIWLFKSAGWNFDGDLINRTYSSGGSVRFKNLWSANFNANYNMEIMGDRISRGGPVIRQPVRYNGEVNVNSNPNRIISYFFGTSQSRDVEGGYNSNFWGGMNIRAVSWMQLNISPAYMVQRNLYQYVRAVHDSGADQTYGNRYVFSEIDQKTLSMTFRLDWTFSPMMTLQTYVRPFISSGKYQNFKELSAPRTYDFEVYGKDKGNISLIDGEYVVDPEGDGAHTFSFGNPDFNFRSVQANIVFRWEYRPGSTLFLVWQQQRSDFAGTGSFDLGRDLNEMFRAKPTNVFLIKASYWFGS